MSIRRCIRRNLAARKGELLIWKSWLVERGEIETRFRGYRISQQGELWFRYYGKHFLVLWHETQGIHSMSILFDDYAPVQWEYSIEKSRKWVMIPSDNVMPLLYRLEWHTYQDRVVNCAVPSLRGIRRIIWSVWCTAIHMQNNMILKKLSISTGKQLTNISLHLALTSRPSYVYHLVPSTFEGYVLNELC